MAPRYRNIGWGCTALFATFAIVFTWAAATNVDGSFAKPVAAAWLFGTFWSAWTILGIYLIVAYYKYRLTTNAREIRQVGVLTDAILPICNITDAEWKQRPIHGSITLATVGDKLKIQFGNLAETDRTELIPILRDLLSDVPQTGWDKFAGPWWSST